MTHTTWPGGVYEQDGPLGAARARRKHLVALDNVAAINLPDVGAKAHRFTRLLRLRLATPRDPLIASIDHAAAPARLLLLMGHSIQQNQRVDMYFPATRQRQVAFGNLFGHHPEREDISTIRT